MVQLRRRFRRLTATALRAGRRKGFRRSFRKHIDYSFIRTYRPVLDDE